MKYFLYLTLIIILTSCSSSDFDIEGKWNGENIPGRKISITFKEKDKSFILIQKEVNISRGNYNIDANHDPKWIDLIFKKESGEKICKGIIEFISKNQIAIQLGTELDRPKEFSTKKSADDENVILSREIIN